MFYNAFISVSCGKLVARLQKGKIVKPATVKGAAALGRLLAKRGCDHWSYSSSIDFAQDHGGEDADLRTSMEEGAATVEGARLKRQVFALVRKERKTWRSAVPTDDEIVRVVKHAVQLLQGE